MHVMFLVSAALVGCKGNPKPNAAPTESSNAAGAQALPAGAKAFTLATDAPLDLGKGVLLTFTKKQTRAGGDNQPPTMKHIVMAKCASGEVVVLQREDEGGDAKVDVTTAGDRATINMHTHIGREGESSDQSDSATLDVATCKVTEVLPDQK